MKTTTKVLGVSLFFLMFLMGITSQGVQADSFNFMANNGVAFGVPAPYATLDVTVASGTATFLFTALQGGMINDLAFNTDLTLNAATQFTMPADFTATTPSGQMDGFGRFIWLVASPSPSDRFPTFTFTISGMADTVTPADFEILTGDISGTTVGGNGPAMFAGHYYPPNSGPTGWIAVPEPGILILLGVAMTAVGVASRFVRKI